MKNYPKVITENYYWLFKTSFKFLQKLFVF